MGLLDALGRGFESWGAGRNSSQYGLDWREKLIEAQAQRRRAASGEERAAAAEERQAAGEKLTLADKLAQSVADMMEAEQPEGSAGQIGVDNYKMNLPVLPPPDYGETLPPELVGRTGMRAEDIVGRARGKKALSRRQLEILKGANRLEAQGRGFNYGTGAREDTQAFQKEQADKNRALQEKLTGERIAGAIQAFSVAAGRTENRMARRDLDAQAADDIRAATAELKEKEKEIKAFATPMPGQKMSPENEAALADLLKEREQLQANLDTFTRSHGKVRLGRSTMETPAPAAGVGPTAKAGGVGGLPSPRSQAEYDALPSGTVFLAPDGKRRRKP